MALRKTDLIHTPQHPPPINGVCQYTPHGFCSGHTVPQCGELVARSITSRRPVVLPGVTIVVSPLIALMTRLSTTGLLRDCAPRLIEQWIESARAAGLIAMSADQYHTLTLTPLGRAVMAGRVEDVRMLVPAAERRTLTRSRRRMSRRSRR